MQGDIWKVPAAGGEPEQVTTVGGYSSHESSDGTRLFFHKDRSQIWEMPVAGGEEKLLAEFQGPDEAWLVLDESLFFRTGEWVGKTYHWTIEEFDLDTGERRTYREGQTAGANMGALRSSPRGEWFLLTENPLAEEDIMLVENFR